MKYKISSGKDVITTLEFLELARSLGWAKRDHDINTVEKALQNTFWIVSIRDNNEQLIGCLRVLSDDLFFSTIPDIFVAKEHQGKGLGNLLLSEVKKRFGHTKIFFGARPGTEEFYEKAGFKKSMVAYEGKFS